MTIHIELLDALRLYQLLNSDTVGHERSCVCRPCARRKSWAGACLTDELRVSSQRVVRWLNLASSTEDHDGVLQEVARDV